jgi:hypothetical protein
LTAITQCVDKHQIVVYDYVLFNISLILFSSTATYLSL